MFGLSPTDNRHNIIMLLFCWWGGWCCWCGWWWWWCWCDDDVMWCWWWWCDAADDDADVRKMYEYSILLIVYLVKVVSGREMATQCLFRFVYGSSLTIYRIIIIVFCLLSPSSFTVDSTQIRTENGCGKKAKIFSRNTIYASAIITRYKGPF